MQLLITPLAAQDLEEIGDYIARWSGIRSTRQPASRWKFCV